MDAGRKLDKAQMVRFDERTGYFASTDLGRIASHFYIKYDTVEVSPDVIISFILVVWDTLQYLQVQNLITTTIVKISISTNAFIKIDKRDKK